MTNGPRAVNAVTAPLVLRPTPGVSGTSTQALRDARGLVAGERADMTYFVPPLAHFGVTHRPDVRLGHTGTPASWNSWQVGKEPGVTRLKGEPALQSLLDGLGQSAVDAIVDGKQINRQYAQGIESESGRKLEGVDRQILQIRRLAFALDKTAADFLAAEQSSDTDVPTMRRLAAALDKTHEDFRAAVLALANDLPTLWKAANGIAVNLDDSHSPIIQQIAQSIADQLDQLMRTLEGVNIATAETEKLTKIFDVFCWRMTSSYADESSSTSLTFRTSPFLHETAYLLIDFLKTHGRIIRADEEGHGAIFELPFVSHTFESDIDPDTEKKPTPEKVEKRFLAVLGNTFWTRQSLYTRAEFAAVLRLLNWGMMADRAQTVEVLKDAKGVARLDRSGLIYLTRTRPLPAIYVRLDFAAGVGLPELR